MDYKLLAQKYIKYGNIEISINLSKPEYTITIMFNR